MTQAIVRVKTRREPFDRLMRISDSNLRILNSNIAGIPDNDTLFRVLKRKGDNASLAKFYNRSLTEKEYKSLVNQYRRDFLIEKAREHGMLVEPPAARTETRTEAPPAAAPETKAIVPQQKTRMLAKVVGKLDKAGWTNHDITNAITTCLEHGLSEKKLLSLAKHGVRPEDASTFIEAHVDLATFGYAAANTWRLFSIKVLSEIRHWFSGNEDFRDFLEFCQNHPHEAMTLKHLMQEGNRGSINDTFEVLEEMFAEYRASRGMSDRMEDILMLRNLGPDRNEQGDGPMRKLSEAEINALVEREETKAQLAQLDIELLLNEQRLAPDAGNFIPELRRRAGGYFVEKKSGDILRQRGNKGLQEEDEAIRSEAAPKEG